MFIQIKIIARDVTEALVTHLHQPCLLYTSVIPVPLHEKRLLERGYNQAALLADVIAKEAGISVVDDVLCRDVYTDRQSEIRSVKRCV